MGGRKEGGGATYHFHTLTVSSTDPVMICSEPSSEYCAPHAQLQILSSWASKYSKNIEVYIREIEEVEVMKSETNNLNFNQFSSLLYNKKLRP